MARRKSRAARPLPTIWRFTTPRASFARSAPSSGQGRHRLAASLRHDQPAKPVSRRRRQARHHFAHQRRHSIPAQLEATRRQARPAAVATCRSLPAMRWLPEIARAEAVASHRHGARAGGACGKKPTRSARRTAEARLAGKHRAKAKSSHSPLPSWSTRRARLLYRVGHRLPEVAGELDSCSHIGNTTALWGCGERT